MIFFWLQKRVRKTVSVLEPHEIFLDAGLASEEDRDATQLEAALPREAFAGFFFIALLLMGGLLLRVAWLEVVSGSFYAALATQNRQRLVQLAAPRGIIADRFGETLVKNIPRFRLIVEPASFPHDDAAQEEMLQRIHRTTGVALDQLRVELKDGLKSGQEFVFLPALWQEVVLQYLSNSLGDGIRVELGFERRYVDGSTFAHVLGYTGLISQEERAVLKDYALIDSIGKVGVEEAYEAVLRGTPGIRELIIDAQGKVREDHVLQEPVGGEGLLLHLDAGLQRVLALRLSEALSSSKGKGAAAVALDPRDGGILALVSLPAYDNNLFSRGITKEDFSKLLQDLGHPLLNRIVAGLYPIGSTIKPFIASAVLQENIVSPWRKIRAPAAITVPNQYNPQIVYTFPDWRDHGFVNFLEAIAFSSDVYFYTVGGGYGDIQGLGIERTARYLSMFGFGQPTGIELSGEQDGRVPTPGWKEQEIGEPWYLGDTYHLAIGQGDFSATPLQLAVATAAVANGGTLVTPRVVQSLFREDGGVIESVATPSPRALSIAQEHLALVRRGMREAVTAGTAKTLRDVSVPVAAKTGTAQFGSEKRTHAWVSTFAPYDDPEIVLIVLVEGGGEGSTAAVPVARDVLSWYFSNADIKRNP